MNVHALDYLTHSDRSPASPVTVLFGDEPFLMSQVLRRLRKLLLPDEDDGFSYRTFDGRSAALADVLDELTTGSLFGSSQKLVAVDQADDWVSAHRPKLEHYVAHPRGSGVLVLQVTTWPKTTKLAKALDGSGLVVECKAPPAGKLSGWLVQWSQQQHGKTLERDAAEVMLELVGPELGLLEQELAKLAVYVGENKKITAADATDLVGGWRAKSTWDMIDAALAGEPATALKQLDRLLANGENAIGVLAQVSFSLRRLAAAGRLVLQGEQSGRKIQVRQALQQAGVQPFVIDKHERQLRQLGRVRAERLLSWLLQVDLDLKGDSPLPPRVVLEQFLVRVAQRPA